jgi:hypothetical protein
MVGFRDRFRAALAEGDAAAARAAASEAKGRRWWEDLETTVTPAADEWTNNAGDAGGQPAPDVADLDSALRQRDDELADIKRLLAEMTDYAEKMEARVIELIAGAEPMAKTLRLPGVKTFLMNKFHPDKYPDADARQRELLTEALKTINAAYALAGELQTSE